MKEGLESLGRVRLAGFGLLAVAFAAGALAGAAVYGLLSADSGPDRPPRPPMLRSGAVPPWLERLDLSADQRERIREILETHRPRTDSILGAAMPRLRAVMDSVHAEIRAVLTPEQREELDRLLPGGRAPGFGPGVRPPGLGRGPPGLRRDR